MSKKEKKMKILIFNFIFNPLSPKLKTKKRIFIPLNWGVL